VDEQRTQRPARPSAPGWHPDPYARHELRYWDGNQWTGHVSDDGTVGLEWAEVPASAGAHHDSQTPVPAGKTLATIGGPIYGGRPDGLPQWATTRSGLHTLPGRPPPSPHFSGPVEPDPWGEADARPWYHAPWLWLCMILGALVIVGGLVVPALTDDGGTPAKPRHAAAKPKPTPDGYRVVGTNTYRFAIPGPWSVDQLDAGVMERGPDAAKGGRLTVATDPFTGDTVSAVPYGALDGDPRDPEQLVAFEADFRAGVAPTPVIGVQTAAIRVQDRPAARLVATTGTANAAVRTISTAIRTTDGTFQVTVTSASPERAALLSALIVPTFAPR
jgi:hypothetical protein